MVTGCVSRRPVYGGVAALTGHSGNTARLTGVPPFCRERGGEGRGGEGRGGEGRGGEGRDNIEHIRVEWADSDMHEVVHEVRGSINVHNIMFTLMRACEGAVCSVFMYVYSCVHECVCTYMVHVCVCVYLCICICVYMRYVHKSVCVCGACVQLREHIHTF